MNLIEFDTRKDLSCIFFTVDQMNARTRSSWSAMKNRCLNPRSYDFPFYGGRGVTVCEHWMSFKNFFEDMGYRPEGKTLDRINTNGNYEPSNCRWATKKEQQNNRTNSLRIFVNGEEKTVEEAAAELGLKPMTIYARLSRGFSQEEALRPAKSKGPRLFYFRGSIMNLSEISRATGVSFSTLRARLDRGQTIEQATGEVKNVKKSA